MIKFNLSAKTLSVVRLSLKNGKDNKKNKKKSGTKFNEKKKRMPMERARRRECRTNKSNFRVGVKPSGQSVPQL